MPHESKLFLIDGTALFYRAYFAFIRNPLINKQGENVSAIYGFANSILKIWKEEKPHHMLVTFDSREPTFRHEMFHDYKANREAMPEDLAPQLPSIYEFVDQMGIPRIALAGFEADDLIGSYASMASKYDMHTYIVTGDKDMMQLLSDKVFIFNIRAISKPEEKKIIKPEDVVERIGVTCEQVVDFMALAGDASDNIPGVTGVGEKTAAKLIQEWGTLDSIYQNIDQIKSQALKEKLLRSRENAFLSRKLAVILKDIELKPDLLHRECPEILPQSLGSWFDQHDFPSLKKYLAAESRTQKEPEKKVTAALPLKRESVSSLEFMKQAGDFDVFMGDEKFPIVILRISDTTDFLLMNSRIALRFDFKQVENEKAFRDAFYKLLSRKKWIGWNIKEIHKWFLKSGLIFYNGFFDLQLAAFLLDPEIRNPSFQDVYGKYAGHLDQKNSPELKAWAEVTQEKQPDLFISPEEETIRLARFCYLFYPVLAGELEEKGMKLLFDEIETPMVHVLARMETNGAGLDPSLLRNISGVYEKELKELRKIIIEYAGEDFNVNSTKQLGVILFEKLQIQKDFGIKKIKSGKTGYTTSSEALMRYRPLPIIEAILRYRLLAKLQSTYLITLIDSVNQKTRRLHATFNQMVTVTGRLSSANPNLQNIPIRTHEGSKIREAFVAEKGKMLLSLDYSQIELRILAHLSDDPVMISAFINRSDIHAETASRIFNVPLKNVTALQRSRAKAVNFGVIYGMGPFRLSHDTGISVAEASAFIKNYFIVYQGVKQFIDKSITEAKSSGQAKNLFGRIRYLPDIHSSKKNLQIQAEHMAVNTPIQGTAADLIKTAMIHIQKKLDQDFPQSKMVLQIHDELLFEVPEDQVKEVGNMAKEEMEKALSLKVPLEVTMGWGTNWLQAH